MNVFSQASYVKLIEAGVEARKRTEPSLTFQKLADIAGIQKSYLSKVLHGRAHLNPDQLYAIAEYFAWNADEQAFAQLLLDHARSGLARRKAKLGERIAEIQSAKMDTSRHIKARAPDVSSGSVVELYLTPWLQLLHVALAVPRFRNSLPRLAEGFRLDLSTVNAAIDQLVRIGMAEWQDKKLVQKNPHLHLPKSSPYYPAWRNQLRSLCLNRLHAQGKPSDYSFSVTFSADAGTRQWLQQEFLELLKRAETRVKSADDQDVYQMNFDLFSWTEK